MPFRKVDIDIEKSSRLRTLFIDKVLHSVYCVDAWMRRDAFEEARAHPYEAYAIRHRE